MPHTPGGGPVTLAGTTWTEVVAAPAAGKIRAVVGLLCSNLDSATRLVSLRRKKGVVTTPIRSDVLIGAGLAQPLIEEGMLTLDATDESLEMRTDATAAATEPVVEAAWMEWSA